MNYRQLFLLFALSILYFSTSAQFIFNRFDNVPVVKGNHELKYPWAGGLNNPQFSDADLNNDGILDLIVFNRSSITQADKLLTFINRGTPNTVDYEYDPTYEEGFINIGPDSLKLANWLLLKDMNCDGIPDALSGTQPGYIHYYKGIYQNDMLTFKHQNFMKFNSNSGPLNIFVSGLDVPAIVDVNFDGDLDILTFGQFGITIHYYENQSVELYGSCQDNIIFEEVDDCWAHLVESGTIRAIDIDTSCGFLKGGSGRHSGSSILAFDQSGDDDIDLVMGNVSYPNLLYVENGCNNDSACIVYQDTLFPSYDVSFDCGIFGISFLADVNNDGLADLLGAPNDPKKSENLKSSWYYKNIGDSNNYVFEFVTDSFLTNEMLDFGEGASPVFVDVNQDGKQDILVGNYGYYLNTVSYKTSLAYLENVGTDSSFAFRLVDLDFENISQYDLRSIHPTFGDLDNDGDLDMILGDETGFIHFFEDTAGPGNPIKFDKVRARYFSIDVGSYSTPLLFDADNDGDLDLIIGERDGNLNYFVNSGTPSSPAFNSVPENGFLGEVNARLPGFFRGFASPFISKLDTTNTDFILCGTQQGIIKVYIFNPDSLLSGSFDLVYDTYSNINEGENCNIAITDLDNDGKFEMVTGNYRGGLSFYSQGDSVQTRDSIPNGIFTNSIQQTGQLNIYPNPTYNEVFVEWDVPSIMNAENAQLQVFNTIGKTFYSEDFKLNGKTDKRSINLVDLPAGIYLVQIKTGKYQMTKKLIKY